MSFFRILTSVSILSTLAGCAVTEPHSNVQNLTSNTAEGAPAETFVQYAQLTDQSAQSVKTVSNVQPRLKPQAMSSVPQYRGAGQASLVRASTLPIQQAPAMRWNNHVVLEGDTAYSLARQFCSRTEDIKRYNGLDSAYTLKIGQPLILPRTAC
jgi:LysM repeat protein